MKTAIALALALLLIPQGAYAVILKCGAPSGSVIKSEELPSYAASNGNYVPLTHNTVDIVVPPGASRCVRLILQAYLYCHAACSVRAKADNLEMNPLARPTDVIQGYLFASNHFEWFAKLPAGPHTLSPEVSADSGNSNPARITIKDWVMDVQY